MIKIGSAVMLLSVSVSLFAQNEIPRRVTNFVPRVVRVTANGPRGETAGFGFIVGDSSTHWYAVTARHVLTDAGGVAAVTVTVTFRRGTTSVSASLVNESEPLDVAALKIPKSATAGSMKGCLHPVPESYLNTAVWLIGREGEWYVSTLPGRINVDGPNSNKSMSFDMVGVRPGNSGGPLLGENGLLGMILEDVGLNEGRAVDIRAIKQKFSEWKLPWGLSDCRLFESKTAEGLVDTGSCEGQGGLFGLKNDCNENSAKHVDVCTTLPANARIDSIRLFRRWSHESGWPKGTEFKSGDNCEWCKFTGAAKESPADGQKRVCWEFLQWSSHDSRTARILVNYQIPADE